MTKSHFCAIMVAPKERTIMKILAAKVVNHKQLLCQYDGHGVGGRTGGTKTDTIETDQLRTIESHWNQYVATYELSQRTLH